MNPSISGLGIRTLDIGRAPFVDKIYNFCFEQLKNCDSVILATCAFGVLGLNVKCAKAYAAHFSRDSRVELVSSLSLVSTPIFSLYRRAIRVTSSSYKSLHNVPAKHNISLLYLAKVFSTKSIASRST